jgi:hypothetical protein
MKKIFTLMLALGLGSVAFSQNMHIYNDGSNHNLDLNFTMFTIVPSTCSSGAQAMDVVHLPPNQWAHYSTFVSSTTAAGHPYPIDHWSPDILSYPPFVLNAIKWDYIKFSMSDPLNPGQIVPTLGGSVGYMNCSGIPATISGTGSLNSVNYAFSASANSFGGDIWIIVQ